MKRIKGTGTSDGCSIYRKQMKLKQNKKKTTAKTKNKKKETKIVKNTRWCWMCNRLFQWQWALMSWNPIVLKTIWRSILNSIRYTIRALNRPLNILFTHSNMFECSVVRCVCSKIHEVNNIDENEIKHSFVGNWKLDGNVSLHILTLEPIKIVRYEFLMELTRFLRR